MEYFSSDDPFAPTTLSYFSPTGILCFRLIILVMAPLSALMHMVFILGIWRLCGVGARSAYLVLGATALLGLSFTFSLFVNTLVGLVGLKWNDCTVICRITGGMYVASGLSTNFLHFYLLLQRVLCIFLPLKVNTILCRRVIQICFFLFVLFYAAVLGLCLSPVAGVPYIPEHDIYTVMNLAYSAALLRANHITNYVVVLSSVIPYPIMLLVLKYKRKSSRTSKEEIKFTSQVALSVVVEVVFFFIFEYTSPKGAVKIISAKTANLWYYNAITLPYFIMNKRIHREIKRFLFHQKDDITMIAANPKYKRTRDIMACDR